MPFTVPPFSPYIWQNSPSGQTPLDAAHLGADELNLAGYIQTALYSYDTYVRENYFDVDNPVVNVFGRTGIVSAQTGDYNVSQVTGAAPLVSPALTGAPTAPTQSALDDSTKVSTTAYTDTAVGVETTRAERAEAASAAAVVAEAARAEGIEATKLSGAVTRAGAGAPSTGLGAVGDNYLDIAGAAAYGPKYNGVTPGSFPSPAIRDSWSATGAPSGNWTSFTGAGGGALTITSTGQATSASGGVGAEIWTADGVLTDQDAYTTIPEWAANDQIDLYVRVQSAAGASYYRLKLINSSPTSTAVLYENGNVLSTTFPMLQVGDGVGFRAVGENLISEHFTSGAWTTSAMPTAQDATWSSGYPGFAVGSNASAIGPVGVGAVSEVDASVWPAGLGIPIGTWQVVPPPTGVAAIDTANVQAALNVANLEGQATVVLSPYNPLLANPSTYLIDATLTLYNATTLDLNGGTLQLAAGTNADLMITNGFYALTGNQQSSSTAGVQKFKIINGTLDGNYVGQTAGINNCWPLRIFGCNYVLHDLDIINGNSGGLWSEWLTSSDPDQMETRISNVRVTDYLGQYTAQSSNPTYGVYWNGPHDTQATNLIISSLKANHASNTPLTYGLYCGSSAPGFLGLHVHVWGRHTHGVYMNVPGCYFANSYSEGSTNANVVMSTNSSWIGGLIMGTVGNGNAQPNETGLQLGDNGTDGAQPTGNSLTCHSSQTIGTFFHNFGSTLPVPTGVVATPVGSGGSFSVATYFWKVTATNASGETLASSEVTGAIVANGSCTLTWTAVTGATGYRIYRATSTGAENVSPTFVAAVGAVTTYTDTGIAVSAGAVPSVNTAYAGFGVSFVQEGNGVNVVRGVADPAGAIPLSTGSPAARDTLEVQHYNTPALGLFQSQSPTAPGSSCQVFAASGTWTKNTQSTTTQVVLIGGGGGGQSGGRQASGSACVGGSGGGAGGYTSATIPTASIGGTTVAVTVGSGGTAGAAIVVDSTAGANGGSGGASTLGGIACALGGNGGSQTTGGAGGSGETQVGGVGAAASATGVLVAAATSSGMVGAGGGGGGVTTGNAVAAGSSGAKSQGGQNAGGTGGSGAIGNNGTNTTSDGGGSGGGGGGAGTAGGFAGGNGGNYGGGGGGGGASQNGNLSGAGGAGGPGIVIVMTW